MTKSSKIKALIIGSYILYLCNLMDKAERHKGSTISLVTWMLKKSRKIKVDNKEDIVKLADDGWQNVLAKYSDENIKIAIAIVIETLYFNHQAEMDEAYGQELGNRIMRMTDKQSFGDISEYAKDSYSVSDSLTESTRKIVFDYLTDKGK